MTYSNKFVMTVRVDGNIIKETRNREVVIPFGSNYVIRFRNKNNKRAVVKFSIDGENVSGNGYIIDANSYIDIERFNDIDRKFKFVSDESDEAHECGKNSPQFKKSNGLIHATFQMEKDSYFTCIKSLRPMVKRRPMAKRRLKHKDNSYKYNPFYHGNPIPLSQKHPSALGFGSLDHSVTPTNTDPNLCDTLLSSSNLENGCTVEGEASNQKFNYSCIDLDPICATLSLQLKGFNPSKALQDEHSKTTIDPVSSVEEEMESNKKKIASLEEQLRLKNLVAENEKLKERIAELESKLNS